MPGRDRDAASSEAERYQALSLAIRRASKSPTAAILRQADIGPGRSFPATRKPKGYQIHRSGQDDAVEVSSNFNSSFSLGNRKPLVEEGGAKVVNFLNLRIRECAWSKFVELFSLDPDHSSQPGSVHTLDTESKSRKAMPPVSPLFKRGPLGRAALLTLISLRVLLPTRGDVRTVSPVENGRYVGPTKRQDVAVRVLR